MALSATFRAAAHAAETSEQTIVLVTLTHPDTAEIVRLCDGWTVRLSDDPLMYGTVSRGNTFTFVRMDVRPPVLSREAPRRGRLILDNVGREQVALIRTYHRPAQLFIELVLGSDPDTVERIWPIMDVRVIDYDASSMEFEMEFLPFATESYPVDVYNPSTFPGLFA
jgi:hypothetical protein